MIQFQRNDHQAVCHHHVGPIRNVKWFLVFRLARVWKTSLDFHPAADRNVFSTANVLVNKHVYNNVAKIHALDRAASKRHVTF